jgi:hypothetical protein
MQSLFIYINMTSASKIVLDVYLGGAGACGVMALSSLMWSG